MHSARSSSVFFKLHSDMSAAVAAVLNTVVIVAITVINSGLTMQIFSGKISRAAASQLINNHMLKRYLVTNHTVLDRIRAWVAVAANRCQLIESRVAGAVEYHVVLDLNYDNDHLTEIFTAEFPEALQEIEFPRSHT